MLRQAVVSIVVVFLAYTAGNATDIRRVVTGLDANDKAVILFDGRLPLNPGKAGFNAASLWTTNSFPPGFSFSDDAATKQVGIAPPENGTVFRAVEFPPLDSAREEIMDKDFLMKLVGDHAPARGLPVKHPLMHRTRTVDYAVVMSGEIDMMLDGTVVHLKAGDVVVQQATNHAWINRGTQPSRVLFVVMDSKQP